MPSQVTSKAAGCLVRVGPSSGVAWAMDSLTEVTRMVTGDKWKAKKPNQFYHQNTNTRRKPGVDTISYPMGSVPFFYFSYSRFLEIQSQRRNSQFPKKDSIPKSQ